MPREPPVPISPQARLLARLRAGLMPSTDTFFQLHSSSSATSCARPVMVPWPISERATRTTQESSGLMATQMFTSVAPFCAVAAVRNGALKPSANVPAVAAAVPTTNLRRERRWPFPKITFFMALSSRPAAGAIGRAAIGLTAGRLMHGLADALIRPAAANVGHRLVDVGIGRLRLLLQQRRRRHDLPGLAVTALRHVDRGPCLLHRVRRIGREALDGADLVARLHGAERHRAGALHFAVDVHRACAALRDAAAVFGAGEADLFADDPQERCVRFGLYVAHFAVDVELCHLVPRQGFFADGHSSRAAVVGDRKAQKAAMPPPACGERLPQDQGLSYAGLEWVNS